MRRIHISSALNKYNGDTQNIALSRANILGLNNYIAPFDIFQFIHLLLPASVGHPILGGNVK